MDGYSQNGCIFSALHTENQRTVAGTYGRFQLNWQCESERGNCVAEQVITTQEMVHCVLEGQL